MASQKSSPKANPDTKLRIALVCDWLTTPGGAEKVLLELHKMYPEAPIYTSQYSRKGINWFDDADVRTGWMQIFPAVLRKFLGPLRQIYFSHLDLSAYDLVISVTGAEAKSVRTVRKNSQTACTMPEENCNLANPEVEISCTNQHKNPRRPQSKRPISPLYRTLPEKSIAKAYHLCYCHVPTQYYWQMYDKYVENPGFGVLNPLVRACFKLLVKPLRNADYKAAQQPDQFVTISSYAREQIQQYYHREAEIIAPPVEVQKFQAVVRDDEAALLHKFSTQNVQFSTSNPQQGLEKSTKNQELSTKDGSFSTTKTKKSTAYPQLIHKKPAESAATGILPYYIIACRQVTWKRVDLAIQACLEAKRPLLVVGDGPEHAHLVQLAENSPLIQFVPWVQTEELALYLRYARGYIFPSLEPFGIAAVEALAAGCPVIAYAEGGSRDYIKAGKNGVLFARQTPVALVKALAEFEQLKFHRKKVMSSAEPFAANEFRRKIQAVVAQVTKAKFETSIKTKTATSSMSNTFAEAKPSTAASIFAKGEKGKLQQSKSSKGEQ